MGSRHALVCIYAEKSFNIIYDDYEHSGYCIECYVYTLLFLLRYLSESADWVIAKCICFT